MAEAAARGVDCNGMDPLKSKRSIRTEGQDFLEKLAASSTDGFDTRFASISTRVGLGLALNAPELRLLYEATLAAMSCYMSLNGFGDYRDEIEPGAEINRLKLERDFMAARDKCYSSAGWKTLPISQKTPIQQILLSVFVDEENLAW